MKALLIGEYREGKLLETIYELIAFAKKLGAESSIFLAGSENDLPKYDGALYLADVKQYLEFNPDAHKKLILSVVEKEKPDYIVFLHSSYGWDLAPRVAFALKAAQVSEVMDFSDGAFVVPACNAKMRRRLKPKTSVTVLTLQFGAFGPGDEPSGTPSVQKVELEDKTSSLEFAGYEEAEKGEVDLTKSEIIVSAGRGIGKKENLEIIEKLADAIGADLGSSRPVVDAGWLKEDRQVGITGQTVSPKLYIACGISGAIQHLAGMKKSEFVVAINTDKDAPIGEVADVFVVADLKQFVPVLTEKVKNIKS